MRYQNTVITERPELKTFTHKIKMNSLVLTTCWPFNSSRTRYKEIFTHSE